MKIYNNIPALRSMSTASRAESKLSIVSRRLSSGVRIGSAKEDPSGISVANKMNMQVKGTKVANQNTLNGISLVQTADAALNEVHSILQRMRELAVQSANDTLGSDDRMKVQVEMLQLRDEIDSISIKTEYNKGKLLNGHCGVMGNSANAKVTSVTESVPTGMYELNVSSPGAHSELTANPISNTAFPSEPMAGKMVINGIEITINADDSKQRAYEKVAEAIEMADISLVGSSEPNSFGTLKAKYSGAKHTIEITSDNPSLLSALGLDAAVTAGEDAVVSLGTGFSNTAKCLVDGNRVTATDTKGQHMVIDLDPNNIQSPTKIEVTNKALILQTSANKDINLEISIGKMDSAGLGIDRINCTTHAGCQEAIRALDFAVSFCSDARTKIGSYVNRLELVSANLDLSSANMDTTLSKIYDTDMAYEVAEMSRYQILQQSGMAILVQANQRPQQIIQLIR